MPLWNNINQRYIRYSSMDAKNGQDDNWIEELLFPLLEVLECIEVIEIYMFGLSRMQYISNENAAAEPTREFIIYIGHLLEKMVEKYPMVFSHYPDIPWKKYVKIGKALESGYWNFIYQLCWKFVSRGIIQVKRTVLDLLYFAGNL